MRYTSFLDAVHRLARLAAEQDDYLDVYGLADSLREEHQALRLSRQSVAQTLMEVGVAYSAPMLLDPTRRGTAPWGSRSRRRGGRSRDHEHGFSRGDTAGRPGL